MASAAASAYGGSSRKGSRRLVSRWACERKKGVCAASWYHRTSSSADGSPKKPPTSAPVNGMPERASVRIIATERR
eukprot:7319144-Prymnesium_polylepis.1